MNEGWVIFWRLAAAALLVLINGFFVAAEFALVRIRDTQLQPLSAQGNRRARMARKILGNIDAYLGACQLGITMASLALSLVGEPALSKLIEPPLRWLGVNSPHIREGIAFALGYTLITAAHIVVGEQAPKFLALKRPLPSSLWVAYPLHWFYRLTFPFITLLNIASNWVLKWLGVDPSSDHREEHSEEELRLMFVERTKKGAVGPLGREIVLNALDLRRRIVRDVMRPRNAITALSTLAPLSECLEIAERTRYSRFPLCEGGNLDRSLGIVHFKDLVSQRHIAKTGADLGPVTRRLIYVPETARLERLLGLFLERRLHFAFVVDEYGGTLGMVTLENCLEELVGQIQDEHDQEKPRLIRKSEDTWELDGSLPFFELGEIVGELSAAEGITSVGGWLTQRLGGFPKRGDRVSINGHELEVTELDHLRVASVTLRRLPAPLANPKPA